MTTTAYRSVIIMRKRGYFAEVTEHRQGHFRRDLFGIADGIAVKAGEPVILFQSYEKKAAKQHSWINPNYSILRAWLESGNRFQHHIFEFKMHNGRKRWIFEIKEVTLHG